MRTTIEELDPAVQIVSQLIKYVSNSNKIVVRYGDNASKSCLMSNTISIIHSPVQSSCLAISSKQIRVAEQMKQCHVSVET